MYIVIEIQTNANGEVGTLINQYEARNQAESKYHQILTSASVSNLPVHTALILKDEGVVLRAECYKNGETSPIVL